MPDRNFMRPTVPGQTDAQYTINTIHDQSNDLTKDINEERLARAAEVGNPRLRRSRIIGVAIFLVMMALLAAYLILQVLPH